MKRIWLFILSVLITFAVICPQMKVFAEETFKRKEVNETVLEEDKDKLSMLVANLTKDIIAEGASSDGTDIDAPAPVGDYDDYPSDSYVLQGHIGISDYVGEEDGDDGTLMPPSLPGLPGLPGFPGGTVGEDDRPGVGFKFGIFRAEEPIKDESTALQIAISDEEGNYEFVNFLPGGERPEHRQAFIVKQIPGNDPNIIYDEKETGVKTIINGDYLEFMVDSVAANDESNIYKYDDGYTGDWLSSNAYSISPDKKLPGTEGSLYKSAFGDSYIYFDQVVDQSTPKFHFEGKTVQETLAEVLSKCEGSDNKQLYQYRYMPKGMSFKEARAVAQAATWIVTSTNGPVKDISVFKV